ncbi:unnamed protein product [Caretta caretta]
METAATEPEGKGNSPKHRSQWSSSTLSYLQKEGVITHSQTRGLILLITGDLVPKSWLRTIPSTEVKNRRIYPGFEHTVSCYNERLSLLHLRICSLKRIVLFLRLFKRDVRIVW